MSAPVKLRSKKPYTCRTMIGDRPCAAILGEADGAHCQACIARGGPDVLALPRELKAPVPLPAAALPEDVSETQEQADARRARWPFWPGAPKAAA